MTRADVHDLVVIAARLAGIAARLAEAGSSDPEELLCEAEAASLAKCSVRTLRDARRTGAITAYGRQRSRTYRRADLLSWIESRRAPVVSGVDDPDMDRRVARIARARRAAR